MHRIVLNMEMSSVEAFDIVTVALHGMANVTLERPRGARAATSRS